MATSITTASLRPIPAAVSNDIPPGAPAPVPTTPPHATTFDNIASVKPDATGLLYVQYSVDKEEQYLPSIRALIAKDLSEPYSIYVYRYFLSQWPHLCFLGLDPSPPHVLHAVIISKLEPHPPPHHPNAMNRDPNMPHPETSRGYVAMLAVASTHRRRGIASRLIALSVDLMRSLEADEVVLETEVSNAASLKVYERLGFIRTKRLHRYYLNGNTAFRLAVFLREGAGTRIVGGGGMMGSYAYEEVRRPDEGFDGGGGGGVGGGGGTERAEEAGSQSRMPVGQVV